MKVPLPRDPGPRAGFFDVLDYLHEMAAFLGDAAVSLLTDQRKLMTQSSDFQGSLDRNTAATSANAAASQQEITQLQAVSQQLADTVAQLNTSAAPTQQQLDQLNAASAQLEASTSALTSDDTQAQSV